jgi:hypothetical protein
MSGVCPHPRECKIRAMKFSRYFALLSCLFLFTAVVHAQTLTGKWNSTVQLGDQSGSPAFVLQQSNDKLTGTYSGALGEAPLHGTVKGTDITFDFDAYGGTIHYVGKLSDDGKKITGTCDYGQLGKGTFTATKAEAAPARQ